MTIDFACDHCGKPLSTADERAGMKAKCPGCGEAVLVPSPQIGTTVVASSDAVESAPFIDTERKTCPMCGEAVRASSRVCEHCGEPLTKEGGAGQPAPLEFGDVFNASWNLFGKQLGLVVVGPLLVTILTMVSAIPTFALGFIGLSLLDQHEEGTGVALLIAAAFTLLLPLAATLYLSAGLQLIFLKVARKDRDVGFQTLFSGGRYVFKLFLASLVFGLLWIVAFGLPVLLGVVLGVALQLQEEAALGGAVLLALVTCCLAALISLRYWAFTYVIVDEDPPGLSCFSRAAELMQGNYGSILLIGFVGFLLHMAISSFCGLLGLFTQPFMTLLFAVSYVKMTGQWKSD